jgi:zinc transport system substrate-binding protein
MNSKKILLICIAIAIIAAVVVVMAKGGTQQKTDNGKLNVSVTSFTAYDFVRQIAGDKVNLTFLLNPGEEMHSYDPNPQDLSTIQNSDLFIYIGGETEVWAEEILETLDVSDVKVLRLMDTVNLEEEQEVDGAEEEEEEEEEGAFDEHIWTSPANSIKMLQSISNELIALDAENEDTYKTNNAKYIEEIKDVQSEIRKIVDDRVRDRLVFGDRMPMQYFLNEFGLTASAAFNGCSTETEPSSRTIAYLVDKVREENIPVVLYIELGQGQVAKTIAEETGAETMQIQSLHNISKTDFDNNETYVSLMTRNLEVLKKALQ